MEKSKQKFLAKSKTVLLEVPALLDITKMFYLYVDKKEGVAKGVITQSFKPWKRSVVYLSKKLDPMAMGWPPSLCIIAATASLVKDSDRLSFGQALIVTTPHAIGVLKHRLLDGCPTPGGPTPLESSLPPVVRSTQPPCFQTRTWRVLTQLAGNLELLVIFCSAIG